jgi:hypothetical protein
MSQEEIKRYPSAAWAEISAGCLRQCWVPVADAELVAMMEDPADKLGVPRL